MTRSSDRGALHNTKTGIAIAILGSIHGCCAIDRLWQVRLPQAAGVWQGRIVPTDIVVETGTVLRVCELQLTPKEIQVDSRGFVGNTTTMFEYRGVFDGERRAPLILVDAACQPVPFAEIGSDLSSSRITAVGTWNVDCCPRANGYRFMVVLSVPEEAARTTAVARDAYRSGSSCYFLFAGEITVANDHQPR